MDAIRSPVSRIAVAIASALLGVVVVLSWLLLAPPQLGGQTAYVIVNGNSMEPGMRRGDLAVVRPADAYAIGDIVTYRHPEIGYVIHRIVAEQEGRFTLQGDNNDFLDSYRPSHSQIVGKLWFHIPGAGRLFWQLRSPGVAWFVLFFAFAGLLTGGANAARSRHGKERPRHFGGGHRMAPIYRNWQDTLGLLLALAIGFGALAWVAFGRPLEKSISADLAYTQLGTFSYEAASADGRIYDAGRATTGEPVYLRLSDSVRFTFTYRLEAQRVSDITGTYRLVAELRDAAGWRRTVPLGEPGSFVGNAFEANGTLRLADLQAHIATLEEQSGVRNERYTVAIRPHVEVSGRIDGVPFTARFLEAELPMSLDRVQLRLDSANPEQHISPVATAIVSAQRQATNSVHLLFIGVPVVVARVVGVTGALVSLALAVALLVRVARNGWRDPAESVEPVAVRIAAPAAAASEQIVDVVSMADLERIAARTGGLILQEASPGRHVCYVRDGAIVYRYAFDPGEYGTEHAA